MNLLNIFRKIGRGRKEEKEEVEKIEKVELNNLPQWIEKNTKEISKQTNKKIKELYEQLYDIINRTRQDLSILEAVDLSKRKTDSRLRFLVEKNKSAYIGHVKQLLESLEKGKEEPEEKKLGYEKISNFIKLAKNKIAIFAKQSAKSFYVTSELVGKELEQVTRDLKKIDSIITEIENTSKEMQFIEDIKENLKKIIEKNKTKNNLVKEIETRKTKLEKIRKEKIKVEKEKEEIKKSSEYLKKEKLKNELEMTKQKLKKNENSVKEIFSSIEKAIEKFLWLEKDKRKKEMIEEYIKNPLYASRKDKNLEILDILDEIEEKIKNDEIYFKEEKKEKILENIHEARKKIKSEIKDFLKKHEEIMKETEKLKKEISSFSDLALGKIENKMDNLDREKEQTKKEIEEILKRGEKLDINIKEIKGKLIRQIEELTNRKIEIC